MTQLQRRRQMAMSPTQVQEIAERFAREEAKNASGNNDKPPMWDPFLKPGTYPTAWISDIPVEAVASFVRMDIFSRALEIGAKPPAQDYLDRYAHWRVGVNREHMDRVLRMMEMDTRQKQLDAMQDASTG